MNGADLLALAQRLHNHAYTRVVRSSFAAFGKASVIAAPVRLVKPTNITIGAGVYIGSGCWIQGGVSGWEPTDEPALQVGNRVSITGTAVISAALRVVIEDDVLIGKGTHISDHTHATGTSAPIRDQGITAPKPVRIGRGAWLGQNVVILPGVTVGAGAVVGANSIVNIDVPSHTLAVGSPARLIRDVRLPAER